MIIRLCILTLLAMVLMGCAPLARQVGREVAPQISTDVAAQVGTEVAIQVGAAIAGQSTPTTAPLDSAQELAEPPYDCMTKTCGKMASCEEAVYKLYVCGHEERDANNNGVPCESLCRGAEVPAIATSFAGFSPPATPTSMPSPARTAPPGSEEIALVTRVIDGDTIEVLLNGKAERIRYVQINTPERDEPCFDESTRANADLVAGKTVRLLPDREDVDLYGRLLRSVYVGDIMVERVLVEQGFAEVVLYPPNDRHYDEFVRLEAEAAAAGRGCHPTGIFADGTTTR